MAQPEPPTFLGDYPMAADSVRLFIIFVGFTLALIAIKVSLGLIRTREWERVLGGISFALIAVTPSVSGLYNFHSPLNAVSTSFYLTGLLLGCVAVWFRMKLNWRWLRRSSHRTPHRDR